MAAPTPTRTDTSDVGVEPSGVISIGSPSPGDFLVLFLQYRSDSTPSGLEAWDLLGGSTYTPPNRDARIAVFTKTAGPSETDITLSSAQAGSAVTSSIYAFPAGCEIEDEFFLGTSDDNSYDIGPLVTSVPDCFLAYGAHIQNNLIGTWTDANGVLATSMSVAGQGTIARLAEAVAASPGSYSANLTSSGAGGAALGAVAVKAGGGGGSATGQGNLAGNLMQPLRAIGAGLGVDRYSS
jgi:hypothetical protein